MQGEITTKPYRWQANGLLALQEVGELDEEGGSRLSFTDYDFLV